MNSAEAPHGRRRIVVDTGILVSAALRPNSVPALALHKTLMHFDVCVTTATWSELETVLGRDKFDRWVTVEARREFSAGLRTRVVLCHVGEIVSECEDPGDDKFLALAWAAGAELIVASDPHLTRMHPWRGIPILPPAAFLVAVR